MLGVSIRTPDSTIITLHCIMHLICRNVQYRFTLYQASGPGQVQDKTQSESVSMSVCMYSILFCSSPADHVPVGNHVYYLLGTRYG